MDGSSRNNRWLPRIPARRVSRCKTGRNRLSSGYDIPSLLYPLTFRPIFKERVWGGRNLEYLYKKPLPPGLPIGESWEISDRPGDVSVIANGPLAGKDLHWLMAHHAKELMGDAGSTDGRFP